MGNANETSAERLSAGFKEIGIDCPAEIVAGWSLENMVSDERIDDVCMLLSSIRALIDSRRAAMLKGMSRIPQAARKTFGNFDISRLSKGNEELVRHLESLDFLSLGENVVIVGDPGTGKTHIAQPIGNLCCDRLIPARYYKISELAEKLRKSIEKDNEIGCINSLISIPCLIIDEVGYCEKLSERQSNLFFQILDRRYDRGKGCTIFTSNRQPSEWRDMFFDDSLAKCIIDRIMDRCIAIDIRGASFRGQHRTVYKLNFNSMPQITGLN